MNRLTEFIRSLHPAVEFGVVMLTAFALPLFGSFAEAANPSPGSEVFATSRLRDLILWELLVLAGLGWFLFVRRWNFARTPLYPSWLELGYGAMLAIGVMVGWTVILPILAAFLPSSPLVGPPLSAIDWPTVIVLCLVNPVFEEFLVCAYIINALRQPLGLGIAVAASIAIRAGYHTYQGAAGFFYAALVGVIFSLWFVRTGKLWPIIVAHAVLDFLPFLVDASG